MDISIINQLSSRKVFRKSMRLKKNTDMSKANETRNEGMKREWGTKKGAELSMQAEQRNRWKPAGSRMENWCETEGMINVADQVNV